MKITTPLDDILDDMKAIHKEREDAFEKNAKEQREKSEVRENIRIKKIQAIGGNQLTYAIQEVINRATCKESFQIELLDLGFSETGSGIRYANQFLETLKNNGCIEDFRNLSNRGFKIDKVDINRLTVYQKELSSGKVYSKNNTNLKIDFEKELFDAYIDEERKVFTIVTSSGKEELGFKKKQIKKEDKRFAIRQEKLNEIENCKSETKFFKVFATFFDLKKEVSIFQEKEIITSGQSIEGLSSLLKVTNNSIRNYISRIRKFILENNLPIKLITDNKGNYQLVIKIKRKISAKE